MKEAHCRKLAGLFTQRRTLIVIAVFFLALGVRSALVLIDDGKVNELGDAASYLALAESIRAGNGFTLDGVHPTALRMPLYPIFLAAISTHRGMRHIQFVQALLDSITCVLVLWVAFSLFGWRIGVISGIAAACYIPMGSQCLYILSETLFSFCLVAGVAILAVAGERKRWILSAGVLFGLASLARPNGLVAAGFILVWFLFANGWKRGGQNALLFILAVGVMYSPWYVRNLLAFRTPVSTYTMAGITLYNSYILPKEGFGYNGVRADHQANLPQSETERSRHLSRLAIDHVRTHPRQALKLIPAKLGLLVYPFNMHWMRPGFPFRYNVFWSVALIFALICMFDRRIRENRVAWLIGAILGSLVFLSVVYYGSPRMRIPFEPLIIPFSVSGALFILRKPLGKVWIGFIAGSQALLLWGGQWPGLWMRLQQLIPR